MDFLPKRNRGNQQLIFLALGIFVLLDLSVLAGTFWLSYQIAQNAVTINLAGRQRMLSQRMVKALLHLERAESPQLQREPLTELRLTFELFDSTLRAFHFGGGVTGGDGNPAQISAVTDPQARDLVLRAEAIWNPYRDKVERVIAADASASGATIKAASAQASRDNLPLLNLMNSLTTVLEQSAINKTSRIRLLQVITFSLAILSFMQIVLMLRRELHMASRTGNTLNSIMHKINAAILLYDDHGILAANQHAATLFGFDAVAMIGLPRKDLLFLENNTLYGRRQDGSTFHAAAQYRDIDIDGKILHLETITDITQQHAIEQTLSYLAYHDTLTGLPNRLLFNDRLQQSILAAKRRAGSLAVLFVDLDGFKTVNDTHGHHIGDLLLKEIASRLRQNLREEDTVSRFGGDEFGILLTAVANREDCEKIVTHLLGKLCLPFEAGSAILQPAASIGISLYPEDGDDEDELLHKADEAMYAAKRGNAASFAFYQIER